MVVAGHLRTAIPSLPWVAQGNRGRLSHPQRRNCHSTSSPGAWCTFFWAAWQLQHGRMQLAGSKHISCHGTRHQELTAKVPIPPTFNPVPSPPPPGRVAAKLEVSQLGPCSQPFTTPLQLVLALWCDQARTGDATAAAEGRKNSSLHVTGKDLRAARAEREIPFSFQEVKTRLHKWSSLQRHLALR